VTNLLGDGNGLVIDMFVPLSKEECELRDKLDASMDKNEDSFIEYLRNLKEYRNKRLYRGKYNSFTAYLAERRKKHFKTRQRADQLINHLEVIDALVGQPGVVTLPENERQTRELQSLDNPTKQAAAWLAAQAASGEDQPSSGWVKSGVEIIVQADVKDAVDTGDGKESPVTAGNVMESTANAQVERVKRMRDHIKANQKSKPTGVFEGTVRSTFHDHLLNIDCVHVGGVPKDVIDKLTIGKQYRFVLYEITEQKGASK
jgi:hypothetical protein